jgi:hypothetical protein
MVRTMQRALEALRSGRPDDVRRARTSLIDIPELATELGVKVSYVRRLVTRSGRADRCCAGEQET